LAIEKVATVTPYQGVLADLDELTETTAYPAGSIFHAVDTGDEFVKYADGWILDLRKARAIKRAELL
jgi:hypothetical protein